VVDFDLVAARVGDHVLQTLDHRLLLHEGDPAVRALEAIGEPLVKLPFHPTAENLARLVFEHARAEGLPVVRVELVEQPGSVAAYSG
jgi:6-pyruvoyltetrahydropterin/6-carboxytetrahydropterin synthase